MNNRKQMKILLVGISLKLLKEETFPSMALRRAGQPGEGIEWLAECTGGCLLPLSHVGLHRTRTVTGVQVLWEAGRLGLRMRDQALGPEEMREGLRQRLAGGTCTGLVMKSCQGAWPGGGGACAGEAL